MSKNIYEKFTVGDLYKYAKKAGIKYPFGNNRSVISKLLADEGVTEDDLLRFTRAMDEFGFENVSVDEIGTVVTEEAPKFDKPDKVVVRMAGRNNSIFEFGPYKFTKNQPIQLLKYDDAVRLVEKYDGFIVTTLEEAKEFYS